MLLDSPAKGENIFYNCSSDRSENSKRFPPQVTSLRNDPTIDPVTNAWKHSYEQIYGVLCFSVVTFYNCSSKTQSRGSVFLFQLGATKC